MIILGLILIVFVLVFMAFRGKTRAKTFVPQAGVIETATFHGLTFAYDSKYQLEDGKQSITVRLDPWAANLTIHHGNISGFSKAQVDKYSELMDAAMFGDHVTTNAQEFSEIIAGRNATGRSCTMFIDGYPFYHLMLTFNTSTSWFGIVYMCSKAAKNAEDTLDEFLAILASITSD